MAVHSTTKTEHRSVVRAAARRFLITAGLTVAGAALTFAFSSAAWAEDTSTSSGTGQSSTTAEATTETTSAPAESTEPAETTATEPSEPSESTQSTGKTSTQQAKPPETTEPETSSASTTMATDDEPEPEPVKQSSSGGGLLGGLVNTVGGVLNAVTSTVGSVGDAVLKPIITPIVKPIDHCPGGTDIVVTIPELDSGFDAWPAPATGDARGHSSTIAVVKPDHTADAVSTTEAPADEPEPARVTPTQLTTVSAPVKDKPAPAPAAPAPKSDDDAKVRAGSGGGGGSPGGGAPSAPPCAPAGHSASAHPGQDNNGNRSQFGVLPSSASTTQLRLIGTSRDHAADGAGRDAALPTTSPD